MRTRLDGTRPGQDDPPDWLTVGALVGVFVACVGAIAWIATIR